MKKQSLYGGFIIPNNFSVPIWNDILKLIPPPADYIPSVWKKKYINYYDYTDDIKNEHKKYTPGTTSGVPPYSSNLFSFEERIKYMNQWLKNSSYQECEFILYFEDNKEIIKKMKLVHPGYYTFYGGEKEPEIMCDFGKLFLMTKKNSRDEIKKLHQILNQTGEINDHELFH